MSSETCTPDVPLEGDLDVATRLGEIEPEFSVKGTFFDKLRERIVDRWGTLQSELDRPPKLGRYLPFNNYPLTDYLRLLEAVARVHYPEASLREGFRLTARDDFTLFSQTTFGKVVLAAVGDPRTAIIQMGTVYTKMAPGNWSVDVTEIDDRTLRAIWNGLPGFWEYQLGQVEGLCMSYGWTPTTTATEFAPRRVQFDIVLP